MDNTTLFFRTDSGNHELQARTPGFPIKQRQLLFLIDGQKRIADLAAFSPDLEDLKLRLIKLQEMGLIQTHAIERTPLPTIFDATIQPVEPVRTKTKQLPSTKALQNVRRIISMTDQTYLANKLEYMLVDVFDVMQTADELQFCIDRWQKTLREAGFHEMADAYMWQVRSALSD
ncbi:hypothetical protein HQ393_11995 [Chitinibacter bivalviorum]|uniref:Uncharacterized protein n=1 Tax=Chitinibacter bivalviorum TaxID=2739434 RepID=A0A7H9BK83_9NEIS|nr:hypothetical protein [Chitinibacter bivalviorum]QLG88899.1 hypothetical protein HQ393_11995 [Chitinibacter bivalviorum]